MTLIAQDYMNCMNRTSWLFVCMFGPFTCWATMLFGPGIFWATTSESHKAARLVRADSFESHKSDMLCT